jgi:hypothetical protein
MEAIDFGNKSLAKRSTCPVLTTKYGAREVLAYNTDSSLSKSSHVSYRSQRRIGISPTYPQDQGSKHTETNPAGLFYLEALRWTLYQNETGKRI